MVPNENICILIPMTMRKMIIPAAAALLVSLMPHIAEAASAPKVRKYSATMAKAHLPTAPNKGTDDYRCFLLDPKVKEDSIIRSIEFIPQRKNYVHHAIIFRVQMLILPKQSLQTKAELAGHVLVAQALVE